MNKLITVIIPFYCIAEMLFLKCIQSVLIERSDIEILVIDDGSPEQYQKVLLLAENIDNRIRVIHLAHGGVSKARNQGILEANGKWVTFIDADDYLSTNSFQDICEAASSYNGDVEIFTGGRDEGVKIVKNTDYLEEDHNYASSSEDKTGIMSSALSVGILPQGFIQCFSYGSPCCKLFDRSFLINNGLLFNENVTFAEDTLFMLNVYLRSNKVFFHNQYLYNYVANSSSVTRRYRPGLSQEMDAFFYHVHQFMIQNGLLNELEKAYYLRAQFEVSRAFSFEFGNLLNARSNIQHDYWSFIHKEPYYTAIRKGYLPKTSGRAQIKRILIEHGLGRVIVFWKRAKEKLKAN